MSSIFLYWVTYRDPCPAQPPPPVHKLPIEKTGEVPVWCLPTLIWLSSCVGETGAPWDEKIQSPQTSI